jgi:membrane protease YdiL (CAAX protease family)
MGIPRSLLTLAGALLTYANVSAWRYRCRSQPDAAGRVVQTIDQLSPGHLAVLAGCLAWAAAERIDVVELGLGRASLRPSAAWGLGLGAAGSAVIQIFFAVPRLWTGFAPPSDWAALPRHRFLRLVFGPMLVGSSLMEEVAFRGLLHAKLGRAFSPRRALLAEAAVFTIWHLVITWVNLARCTLSPRLRFGIYCGSLGVLFTVGAALALLRERTGHIAGGVLAHWLLLVSMGVALARPRTTIRISGIELSGQDTPRNAP